MSPKEIASQISEKTSIPLSLMSSIIAVVVVLVIWGKSLEARVEIHMKEDEDLGRAQALKIDETQKLFYSIDSRLSRIEGALGVKK